MNTVVRVGRSFINFLIYATIATFVYIKLYDNSILESIEGITISNPAKNADSWNIIGVVILINVSILLFLIASGIVRKVLPQTPKNRVWRSFYELSEIGLTSILTGVLFILLCNIITYLYSFQNIHNEHPIENNPIIVLGTGKYLDNGSLNYYYESRILKTAEIYSDSPNSQVVISADNSSEDYNEPRDMKNDLIQNGVPSEKIIIDYAGFRTLDSIVRLKYVLGINKGTVISQKFHLERALSISRFYEMSLDGVIAKGKANKTMILREMLGARPKMILDLIILNTQPKYGKAEDRIQISLQNKSHLVLVLALSVFTIAIGVTAFMK